MTTWHLASILAGLALVASPGRANSPEGSETPQTKSALDKAVVTVSQALDAVMKKVEDARPYLIELHFQHGDVKYAVKVVAGERVIEGEVDAKGSASGVSFSVYKTMKEGGGTHEADAEGAKGQAAHRKAAKAAKITMAQAVEIASKEVKDGKPYAAKLEMEEGKATYEVKMMTDGGTTEVKVDAASGKVLKVEKAEAKAKAAQVWNFDKDPVGMLPPGWAVKQNNPTTGLANWMVMADPDAPSKPNVLAVRTGNENRTFNLAIVEKTVYGDLDLSVKVRGNTGKLDQGGGLVWRYKDENNYYVCRINPLEPNYRLYKVVDGKRQQIQSAQVETLTGKWYTVRAVMVGDHITCFLDGTKVLDATDAAFKDAGKIGLWTKADASSSFDDLTVRAIGGQAQRPETGGREGKPKEKE